MEKDITLEYAAFLRSFKRNIDVPHSFLLGAGASISSGVQSAYDCIWEWKKGFFVKFGGTSSIVNKESWLSVVCFLPYCTSAFLPL